MANKHFAGDLKLVLNGLRKVLSTSVGIQKADWETKLTNSSLKSIVNDLPNLPNRVLPTNPTDILERASMVPHGVYAFAKATVPIKMPTSLFTKTSTDENFGGFPDEEILLINEDDLDGIYIKSLGVELLQQNEDGREFMNQYETQGPGQVNRSSKDLPNHKEQTASAPAEGLSAILDFPHPITAVKNILVNSKPKSLVDDPRLHEIMRSTHSEIKVEEKYAPTAGFNSTRPLQGTRDLKPLSKTKPASRLGATSKERKVPASRISRLVSYGGLAAGLGIGAITEITKRSFGLTNQESSSILASSPFLSPANAERIVDTLCRVRGAALKLGQILSIQDNSMINPQLQKVFERVRHSADFMPNWQMEKMMESEFGSTWRTKLGEFDMKPFAAASIGQVHLGKLHDGRPVAVKIQYPGVAQGIESDIDNLMSVLGVWKILPEGIFADNIIEVAKRELRWEVDYIRESECAKRFRILLEPYPDYYVPEVIDELTTKQVYTTELIEGKAVDQCERLDQDTRNRISYLMLDLFFRELFEFRFMQTDPNWSNFLYNTETKQIGLLDFGASREYSKEFVDKYLMILKGATENDVKLVLEASRDIGFLTGYESKAMEKAHVDTVMLLGEGFRIGDEAYDFGTQRITQRIQELVPVMVKERLCPPPEEIYSLHRKLSGVFLLCAKLRGKVQCKPIFDRIWSEYKFGPENSV